MTPSTSAKEARSPDHIRDVLRLASCPSSDAVRWLESREVVYSNVQGIARTLPECHLLEYVLLRRRNPYIDAALAEHGRSRTVLDLLYRRAGAGLRAILAGNGSFMFGDRLTSRFGVGEAHFGRIVSTGSDAELRAVCSKAEMPSGAFANLMGAWSPDKTDGVSEERFRRIVTYLAGNPRIAQPREESRERHYLDGSADYHYNRFFVQAWELAAKVPVTTEWATALTSLYRMLYVPYSCIKDVEAVLDRWRPADETEYAVTRDLRRIIAAKLISPSLDQLNNPDPSMRAAFFETFDPADAEFTDLNWSSFLDLDDSCVWYLPQNMKVWASPLHRQKLEQLLWQHSRKDSDLFFIGMFKQQKEHLEKEHPDWFTPTTSVEPAGPTPELIELRALRLQIANSPKPVPCPLIAIGGILLAIGFAAGAIAF